MTVALSNIDKVRRKLASLQKDLDQAAKTQDTKARNEISNEIARIKREYGMALGGY